MGHQKLFSKVAASASGKEYRIYPSRSTDPKKNPLDPDSKIAVMRKMYPDHGERIINDPQARTIFDVLVVNLIKKDTHLSILLSVLIESVSLRNSQMITMEDSTILKKSI